jgi:photosystem II stability/assembly factor-like uncharacterized protein
VKGGDKLKKIALLMFLAVLLLNFTGCRQAIKSKTITINSDPEGAVVYVGAINKGSTPLKYTFLYGDYTITLVENGYKSEEKQLAVNDNTQTTLSINLTKLGPSIKIDVDKKLSVILDGTYTGKTTPVKLEDVTEGKHEIQLISTFVVDMIGYSLVKSFDLSGDITLTENDFTREPEQFFITNLAPSGIVFDKLPIMRCCSAAATTYSGIYFGDALTISGFTDLKNLFLIFPSGKEIQFDMVLGLCKDCVNRFSKKITFDELGEYDIQGEYDIKSGEILSRGSFSVYYKAIPLPPTVMLSSIFTQEGTADDMFSRAVAVPENVETQVKLLLKDGSGNIVRNKPIGKYDLKTDDDGIVSFNVSVKGCIPRGCCPEISVNGKPAGVLLYADILVWGYVSVSFTRTGQLIKSSIPGISSDTDVKIEGNNIYMPYGSFGFGLSDMYSSDLGSRNNNIVTPLKNSSIIYTDSFVSKDSGLQWQKLNVDNWFDIIAIEPNNPNILYGWKASMPNFILKSNDYGTNFEKISVNLNNPSFNFINQILVDPADSDRIYLATSSGLFKSDNGGEEWKNIKLYSEGEYAKCIAIDPKDSNIIFACTTYGFYKSEDQGKTWKKLTLSQDKSREMTIPNCIVLDNVNPDNIYVGTDYALFVSRDGGDNWKEFTGFDLFGNNSIAVDPNNSGKVFISSYGDKVYESEDYGEHFKELDFMFSFITDNSITVNSLGELLINDMGIPFKLNKDGNFIPLDGDNFLKDGPDWKIIDGKFYIAINTINASGISVIITGSEIRFEKLCDMVA